MKIDFFATRIHYIDHMWPIWEALPDKKKGTFYIPAKLKDELVHYREDSFHYLISKMPGYPYEVRPEGDNPILICSHDDLLRAYHASMQRILFFMEHGVGLTFPGNPGYAGGGGLRNKISLTLAPNSFIYYKTLNAIPHAEQEIIGTPKMDGWETAYKYAKEMPEKPVVTISFHWPGDRIAPEAGNALWYYRNKLKELSKQENFKLLGHAHPRHAEEMQHLYDSLGIPFVKSFETVMELSNLYVCDASSTLYEFLVTGYPVVILNSPKFDKNVNYGIRFWEYTDIGKHVDHPDELIDTINWTINNPNVHRKERIGAIADLYPHIGESADRAAKAMVDYLSKQNA